ncbi:50S ribosomal protein L11 methyltransferase [Desulfobacca acetoxidans]|uniref:Ribosomal protein L11 methyltransferase n=1 Tax=Desulfobacca acetoxidans (strain ATCC 700848 / DSM 11109 / ASRB2) TaxID=880072 RepID=F2NJA6_DESAR|nr:50S ribosomal protein L11 methyltransferase [Desulfobacca acetoxidans]AEB09278.1 Ribosomal protein L11 methyltransferase [Desulfobacca acetoxidans DSM 11109]
MPKQKWLEIRILLPETLQEEAGIFLTGWSGRGVVLEDAAEIDSSPRLAGIRAYLPAGEFTADIRQDLFTYLDRLAALGYRIGELQQQIIEEEDWERAWQVHFKARRLVGRFVIRPPWEEYNSTGPEVVLTIYPGMAFGTGRHPSTWLCLKALEEVTYNWSQHPPRWVLDVGTGTGILGLAAARLGARVLAIDVDPEALAAARENILLNELHDLMRVEDLPLSAIRQQFDLIFANLTAPDLQTLAESLAGRLLPEGQMIISGFLQTDLPEMEERFRAQGLQSVQTHLKDDWAVLVLKRR